MDQWPLSSHKLSALQALVKERLTLGHIEPSTSPYNTPIFVIQKKSNPPSFRLLQDLRAINQHILPMGTPQMGLPVLSAIPKHFHCAILDLKDCFFSIPLAPQDKHKFAFTVPLPNNMGPQPRFQWTVLPQGMKNSPAICQMYVNTAVQPLRSSFYILHYMDDILIAHSNPRTLEEGVSLLLQNYKT